MGFEHVAFWLFLAAIIVASLAFVSIIIWTENHRRERSEFYRFEFRKRLVEAGKMDSTSVASLMRYEHELKLQQVRQKLLIAAWVFLGIGVGSCLGLQFIDNSIWKLGFIPGSIGLCLLLCGLFFAAKPRTGSPPLGWSPETTERD